LTLYDSFLTLKALLLPTNNQTKRITMKKWLLSLFLLAGLVSFASAQSYDLWLWNGLGPAPTALAAKGVGSLSSATIQATATGSAGWIYRKTDWTEKYTVDAVLNTAGLLDKGGADGSIPVTSGKYYTINVPSVPVNNLTNPYAVLETKAAPVTISSVTRSNPTPIPTDLVEITVTTSTTPGSDEHVYVVYTTTAWASSTALPVSMEGNVGYANIPDQVLGTNVAYYAMTSTVTSGSWGANRDVLTLKANTNGGLFYSYTVSAGPDETAPTTVTDLTATADADLNQITLTWSPVTEENFDTYEIFYNKTGSVSATDTKLDKNDISALGSKSTATVTITGLNYDEMYFFRIRGVDASSNAGTLSNEINALTIPEPLITMDGVFDGEERWGPPVSVSDMTAGWAGANAQKLYVTYDDNYLYVGAEVTMDSWMRWVFILNTKSGGAGQDSWGQNVYYGHSNLPDFSVRKGNSTSVAQFNAWDGSAWSYDDATLTENRWYKQGSSFIEFRLSHSMIGNALLGDLQFYVVGNNAGHGAFDCIPDDDNSTAWDGDPGARSDLVNYATAISLPVELSSFTGKVTGSDVLLTWTTATEKNNYGFEIQKLSGADWKAIGFVSGKGTTTEANSYSFTDKAAAGKASYRLMQQDLDGSVSYSQVVEVSSTEAASFKVSGNYPNPFNPATIVEFTLPSSGQVQFSVFNMLGQEVASSVLAGTAGLNQLHFRADGLSSGIYVYRVTFNGKSFTRTMSILK